MTESRKEKLERMKTAKKRGGSRVKNRLYKILDGQEHPNLPPQAVKLVEILFDLDKKVVHEQVLYDEIQACNWISVKQDPWHVFQYYRLELIKQGFLVETSEIPSDEDNEVEEVEATA